MTFNLLILLNIILLKLVQSFDQDLIISENEQIFSSDSHGQFRNSKNSRQLQSCVSNCEMCDAGNTCLICPENRIIPNCECRQGYFQDDQGECKPCIVNCKICDQNGKKGICDSCFENYDGDGTSKCTCRYPNGGDTCDEDGILFYTNKVGFNQQFLQLTFSSLIRIAKIDESKQFIDSQDNCKILSQATLLNFGIGVGNTGKCSILQSEQNIFYIYLDLKAQVNDLKVPKIDSSNILKYKEGNQYPVKSVSTKDTKINVQLNNYRKICYTIAHHTEAVVNQDYTGSYQSIFKYFEWVKLGQLIQVPPITSTTTASYKYTGVFEIKKSQLILDSIYYIQMPCTDLFGITTIELFSIKVVSAIFKPLKFSVDEHIIVQSFLSNNNANKFYFYHNSQKEAQSEYADLQLTLTTIPKVSEKVVLGFGSSTNEVIYTINQYAVKSDQMVFIMGHIVTQNHNLEVTQLLPMYYISNFEVSIIESGFTMSPKDQLNIHGKVDDYDNQVFDQNNFLFTWKCFELKSKGPCLDKTGTEIEIQNDINLYYPKGQLLSDKQYEFTFLAWRKTKIINKKFAKVQIITTSTMLFSEQTELELIEVNLQDLLIFELFYVSKQKLTFGSYTYFIKMSAISEPDQEIQAKYNLITYPLEDYFPNLGGTEVSVILSIFDPVLNLKIINNVPYIIGVRLRPQNCILNVQDEQNKNAFQTIFNLSTSSCIDQVKNNYSYQFFVYITNTQRLDEIKVPKKRTRKMLSILQSSPNFETMLPPGNLVLMVFVIGAEEVRTNFTTTLIVQQNNFNQNSFEVLIRNEYAKAQTQSNQRDQEIVTYSNMMNAIESYEELNPSYNPPNDIIDIKVLVIQRLVQLLWVSEHDDISLQAAELIIRMKKSKVKLNDLQTKDLITANESKIDKIIVNIQIALNTLSELQRIYFQNVLSAILYDYIFDQNFINQWIPANNQNVISQIIKAAVGISQSMKINQNPHIIETQGPQIFVEKVTFEKFMIEFYDDYITLPTADQLKLNYLVNIQTWPTTHPLYRDELIDINKDKWDEANPKNLILLKRTYPIIIPQIYQDTFLGSRRLLIPVFAQISSPFKIKFGEIQPDEKLKCIQRTQIGKWVQDSCKAETQIIDSKKIITCSCTKPDITSLIADAEALFTDNEKIQDIFSEQGAQNIFQLENWYQYAPIWTMIGLQVVLVCLVIAGCKLDNRDKLTDLRNQNMQKGLEESLPNTNKKDKINKQFQRQESIFMKIRNRQFSLSREIMGSDFQNTPCSKFKSQALEQQNQIKKSTFQQQVIDVQDESLSKEIKPQQQEIQITIQSNLPTETEEDRDQLTESEQLGTFCPSPQPENKEQHINMMLDSIKLEDDNIDKKQNPEIKKEEEIKEEKKIEEIQQDKQQTEQKEEQQVKEITEKKDITIPKEDQQLKKETVDTPKSTNKNENSIRIKGISNFSDSARFSQYMDNQSQSIFNSSNHVLNKKDQKRQDKKRLTEYRQQQFEEAKLKVEQYLKEEKRIIGILAFHQLFSIFFLYDQKLSRPLRFTIYYNKLVWLLTLNAVFGKNISVVQVIVLSSVTTIALFFLSSLLKLFLGIKKLKCIAVIISTSFLGFCYYSILVIISDQEQDTSNLWILSYFITFFLNEFVIGVFVDSIMYCISKNLVHKIKNKLILHFIGVNLLMRSFLDS